VFFAWGRTRGMGRHTIFSPEDTSTIQLSQCERHPYHALVRRYRPHHHALVRWDRPHHTAISGPPQHDCLINCNPQHQRSPGACVSADTSTIQLSQCHGHTYPYHALPHRRAPAACVSAGPGSTRYSPS
jgi:hypothetical protein